MRQILANFSVQFLYLELLENSDSKRIPIMDIDRLTFIHITNNDQKKNLSKNK